jgi:hypothetical protein
MKEITVQSNRKLVSTALITAVILLASFIFYMVSVSSVTFSLVESKALESGVREMRSEIALLQENMNVSLYSIEIGEAIDLGFQKTTISEVINTKEVVVLNQ